MFDGIRLRWWKKRHIYNTDFDLIGAIEKIQREQLKLEEQQQHKIEIDDLKLRICVLEDEMKEHNHIRMSDLCGLPDMGKITSRYSPRRKKCR